MPLSFLAHKNIATKSKCRAWTRSKNRFAVFCQASTVHSFFNKSLSGIIWSWNVFEKSQKTWCFLVLRSVKWKKFRRVVEKGCFTDRPKEKCTRVGGFWWLFNLVSGLKSSICSDPPRKLSLVTSLGAEALPSHTQSGHSCVTWEVVKTD